jgi:ribosome-binding factor A
VGELVRAEISQMLLRELDDPGIQGLVTFTSVKISADFSHAVVHVSVYGTEGQVEGTLESLQRAAGFIRSLLKERLDLRKIPVLEFVLDDTAARAQRIEQTIRELREERGEEPIAPSPAEKERMGEDEDEGEKEEVDEDVEDDEDDDEDELDQEEE